MLISKKLSARVVGFLLINRKVEPGSWFQFFQAPAPVDTVELGGLAVSELFVAERQFSDIGTSTPKICNH
ncbi:protein of unknown function [Candidatus Filomicrobium marinum]|uniref:Uncharacterized protein n=1 Tax=Candidatus Filomicrobium marinum TaxID=1608628 RepID=A0A0D6JJD9_9HYPH|nr:protein of unknown function [Candidatus Filomicrobium marinum]CPR22099.1 protein of unknown function [Candidatus Filomicrobium marinum]